MNTIKPYSEKWVVETLNELIASCERVEKDLASMHLRVSTFAHELEQTAQRWAGRREAAEFMLNVVSSYEEVERVKRGGF